MTDHTYAYNDLTHFEYEANAMAGNGNHVTGETCLQGKFVNWL